MNKYDIYYENLGGGEDYLDKIIELLDGNQNIVFHINGLIIDLTPGMTKDEVINIISTTRAEFEKKETEIVEKREDESLLAFSKRLAQMSNTRDSYYTTIYKSQKVIAVPGCTDFDILYQIMQINGKVLAEDENTEEMKARRGEDYIQFGERVFEELKKGKNINGHFNNITMPFTSDLANSEFVPSDAFTFSSMIFNMQYSMSRQNEAFRKAREESTSTKIDSKAALESALKGGTTPKEIGNAYDAEHKDPEEQDHYKQ